MADNAKGTGEMSAQELTAIIAKTSGSENPDNPTNTTTTDGAAEGTTEVDEAHADGEGESIAQPEPEKPGQTVKPVAPAAAMSREEFDALSAKMNALAADTAAIRRDNENLRKLNGHLSNELGVLRKPPVKLPTDEEMLSEPTVSTKKVVEATLDERDQVAQAQRELTNRRSQEIDDVVRGSIPDFTDHINDMAKILEEHKAPPEFIAMFKANPSFAIPDAGHLVQLAARAKERKITAARDSEISDLKKQLDAAKKGTTKMATSLKDAAAAGPSITSTTVKTGKTKAEAPPDFQKMKTDDIQKWLVAHPSVEG